MTWWNLMRIISLKMITFDIILIYLKFENKNLTFFVFNINNLRNILNIFQNLKVNLKKVSLNSIGKLPSYEILLILTIEKV